jgi:hypothetical protein
MPSVDTLAKQVAAAYPAMSSYAKELVETAGRLSIDPAWLANIIQLESGGNPQAVNRSGSNPTYATGLIQFMPKTARGLGTTTDALYLLDGKGQMPWVQRYFEDIMRTYGPLRTQEDVIAAVFFPAYIGKPMAVMSAAVQAANPGITTVRDYTNKLTSRAKLSVSGIGMPGLGGGATSWLIVTGMLLAGAGAVYVYRPEAYTRDFWQRMFKR